MTRFRRIILAFIALACTCVAAAVSSEPFWAEGKRAALLTVAFGSMGAGVALTNLVREMRGKK